jgi:hypothetical protein
MSVNDNVNYWDYIALVIDEYIRAVMEWTWWKNQSTQKHLSYYHVATTNHTWTGLGSNPGLQSDKPTTDCLSNTLVFSGQEPTALSKNEVVLCTSCLKYKWSFYIGHCYNHPCILKTLLEIHLLCKFHFCTPFTFHLISETSQLLFSPSTTQLWVSVQLSAYSYSMKPTSIKTAVFPAFFKFTMWILSELWLIVSLTG